MALTFVTSLLRIASPSGWTIAEWSVIRDAAFSVVRARVALGARVLALLVDARCVNGTIRVVGAFDLRHRLLVTVDERISNQVCGAGTRGFVVSR